MKDFLGLLKDSDDEETVRLILSVVDADKDGYISFADFRAFEGLLCLPDAMYKIAFRMFDLKGTGVVSYSKFNKI